MMLLRNEREILYICCGEEKDREKVLLCLKDMLPFIREPEIRQTAACAYQKILAMSQSEYELIDLSDVAAELADEASNQQ